MKILFVPALCLLLFSCSKSKEEIAQEKIREFVQKNFNDPKSYENIEYGKLIPTLDTERSDREFTLMTDSMQLAVIMERNDSIDPAFNMNSIEVQTELQRQKNEREDLNKEYSGMIYTMTDKFRSKNGLGALSVATHTFVFDSLLNIRNCKTE